MDFLWLDNILNMKIIHWLFLLLIASPASAAYYAEVGQDSVVIRVVVVDDAGSEANGIAFCQELFKGGTWIKTEFDGSLRKNYAGIGYKYDAALDAFVPPQPFQSWILNKDTANWEAPVPRPNDGTMYKWDEKSMSWIKL